MPDPTDVERRAMDEAFRVLTAESLTRGLARPRKSDHRAGFLAGLNYARSEGEGLREALTFIQGESYLSMLAGNDVPSPGEALDSINSIARQALSSHQKEGEKP